jgi:hypothetical protein
MLLTVEIRRIASFLKPLGPGREVLLEYKSTRLCHTSLSWLVHAREFTSMILGFQVVDRLLQYIETDGRSADL